MVLAWYATSHQTRLFHHAGGSFMPQLFFSLSSFRRLRLFFLLCYGIGYPIRPFIIRFLLLFLLFLAFAGFLHSVEIPLLLLLLLLLQKFLPHLSYALTCFFYKYQFVHICSNINTGILWSSYIPFATITFHALQSLYTSVHSVSVRGISVSDT
jgi:hypothetical protein